MQTQRQLQIIQILIRQDSYITITDIANKLSVSNRTIRNDLNEIEPLLHQHKVNLIKKTGVGIKIEGELLSLFSYAKEHLQHTQTFDAKERQSYIILRILSQNQTRILDLIDELYVSRATLQKDFQDIEKLCDDYRLKFTRLREKGVFITGEERHIRILMFDLMLQDPTIHILNKFITDENTPCDGSFIFYGLDFVDDEISHFVKTINREIPLLRIQYNPNTLSMLFAIILVITSRCNLQKTVNLSSNFKDELKKYHQSHELSKEIIRVCSHVFKSEIACKDEEFYLQAFVIAYQPGSNLEKNGTEKLTSFTKSLIKDFSKALNLPLDEDQVLYDDLYEHLRSMYLRVKHGIQMNNPLQMEISLYYQNTFDIVKQSFKNLENPIWNQISDDELGLITFYIASALERQKKPLNTLLITDFGKSNQSILKEKI